MMDLEEEIDLFFVRKDKEAHSSDTAEYYKSSNLVKGPTEEFKCIPLMCKHLVNLNAHWKGTNAIKIFSGVQFTHCLAYGKIISKEKDYKYTLDDGTDSLPIRIFKKVDDFNIVCKMENELQVLRKELMAQKRKEIVDSLQNLVLKTKQQIDNADLNIGSKILAYGKPTYVWGKIMFNVYSFIKDEKSNRNIEINFKDYLIYWYKNNCIL